MEAVDPSYSLPKSVNKYFFFCLAIVSKIKLYVLFGPAIKLSYEYSC